MKTTMLALVTFFLFYNGPALQANEPGQGHAATERSATATFKIKTLNLSYKAAATLPSMQPLFPASDFACKGKKHGNSLEKLLQWDFKLKWQLNSHISLIFSYN